MVEWLLVVVTAAGMQTASFSDAASCEAAKKLVLENPRLFAVGAECYENVWH